MMIRKAVAPLAATFVNRIAGALGPIERNSMATFAAWNRKMPSIIETAAQ